VEEAHAHGSVSSREGTERVAKRWNRAETWLTLIVLGIGALVMAVSGLFVYSSATAPVYYPTPQDVPSVAHQLPSTRWNDAVARAREILRSGIAGQNLPGVSVAVGVAGQLVWAEAFGWADVERRVPFTPDTPFRIGSASTMVTAAAAGMLIEQGTLELDEAIQTYVPVFPEKQWPVTVRHLMAHTAGIEGDAGDEEPMLLHCDAPADGLERFATRKQHFEPGTTFHYSSFGWRLVTVAIEAAAGESYATFVRTRILEPLGMRHTTIDGVSGPPADMATYYFPRFAANPRYGPQEPSPVDFSCFSGSGAIISTPSDMVRFGLAVNGGGLLKTDTVARLQASERLDSGAPTGYGLGWDLETVTVAGRPTDVIETDGELRGGMVATFITWPERGIVIAIMSNTSHADTASLGGRVLEIFAEPGR